MNNRAVVWTRHKGPRKLADLRLLQDGVQVSMGRIGLVHTEKSIHVTRGLPAQLQALLPARNLRNLQRRIVQPLMERDGIELRD